MIHMVLFKTRYYYLKTKHAAGFAEERYFIEVRPLTIKHKRFYEGVIV